jgi:hypothetical protein
MGNQCQAVGKLTKNTKIKAGKVGKDTIVCTGQVRLLMTCLDYEETEMPLTCTTDGDNVVALAEACGVEDITYLRNTECVKDDVIEMMFEVMGRCEEGDFFVFYYSGHGTSIPDKDGDEEDGKDEALCYVTPDGQISYESCMIDDVFCDTITGSIGDTPCLILTDCCHSGTIADLTDKQWNGHKAIAFSGCTDTQTSGDTGHGGIMTTSMLLAIAELRESGAETYTLGTLYNATLKKDDFTFNSPQDISISSAPGFDHNKIAWPMVPGEDWEAPEV